MAIFGKTAIGGTQNTQSANFEEAYPYQLLEVGRPISIFMYLTGLAAGPQVNRFTLRRCDHSTSTIKPGTLIDVTPEITIPQSAAAAWYEGIFSNLQVDLQPDVYWIGVWAGTNTNGASLAYDVVSNFGFFEAETYHPTNPPATNWTGAGTHTHQASVYCNYAPRIGPVPVRMPQGV